MCILFLEGEDMLKKLLKRKPMEEAKTTKTPVKRRTPSKTTPSKAPAKKPAVEAEVTAVAAKKRATTKKSERLLTAEGYRRMVARKLS